MSFDLLVNGRTYNVACDPAATLIDVLRNDLDLLGTKLGCAIGYCGACTVLVNGRAAHSCCLLAGDLVGAEIVTVEGMRNHRVTAAIVDALVRNGAVQCGACTPGMVMTATDLLSNCDVFPVPDADIERSLLGNMCRCTGYVKLIESFRDASCTLNGR